MADPGAMHDMLSYLLYLADHPRDWNPMISIWMVIWRSWVAKWGIAEQVAIPVGREEHD